MPRNAQGVPIASADYDASDGFSPGQTIVVKVPGLDTPAAFARTGAVPITDLARTYDRDQPVVVVDARTGAPPAHLGRARRQREHPGRHDAAHPPRPGLDRGAPLRRRPARPARRRRPPAARRPGVPPLPRRDPDRRPRLRTPPGAHGVALPDAGRAPGSPRRSLNLAWDFTVASSRSLTRRMLPIRDGAFAELGDRDLARRARPRPLARVHDRPGHRLHRRPAAERGPPRRGPRDRPVLPRPARVPPGLALPPRAGRAARAAARATRPRRTSSATSRARPRRARRRGRRSTATGCSGDAGEVGADNVEQLGNDHDVLVCATRLGRDGRARTSRTPSRCSRTSRGSRRSPTASSRAS